MRKKTALQTPRNPKASPNQPPGLIAKGQTPGESAQDVCVLANRSHRTFPELRRRRVLMADEATLLNPT